jgi:hypothetical protein
MVNGALGGDRREDPDDKKNAPARTEEIFYEGRHGEESMK